MDKKSSILVIDDEPALRVGLAALIKRQGYEVVTAADGYDGLKKAKDTMPALILSDVMMPPPNGFELRRLMSQDPQLASIPFIFLTARTDTVDRVNGIRGGADDYITKPYVPDELLARIEAVLRRVEMEQARGREQMEEIAQQNLEKLKHEILQNFQHELRTPLTSIIMPLEFVMNNKFESPEEQIRFIRIALSSLDRLESLVNDFILLTSFDQGSLNPIRQVIDVESHILGPVRKRMERYKSKNLEFIQDVTVQNPITAPRFEFTRALVHLVDNAFKFSPQNGKVKLTVESGLDGGAVITVQNDGHGIPVDLREKVFERYYQISHGDTRTHEGLGVGLAIARGVFEKLGGKLSILDSSEGCYVQAILPDRKPEDLVYA
jgi:two-component system, sensor histidine kinase and response regulator